MANDFKTYIERHVGADGNEYFKLVTDIIVGDDVTMVGSSLIKDLILVKYSKLAGIPYVDCEKQDAERRAAFEARVKEKAEKEKSK